MDSNIDLNRLQNKHNFFLNFLYFTTISILLLFSFTHLLGSSLINQTANYNSGFTSNFNMQYLMFILIASILISIFMTLAVRGVLFAYLFGAITILVVGFITFNPEGMGFIAVIIFEVGFVLIFAPVINKLATFYYQTDSVKNKLKISIFPLIILIILALFFSVKTYTCLIDKSEACLLKESLKNQNVESCLGDVKCIYYLSIKTNNGALCQKITGADPYYTYCLKHNKDANASACKYLEGKEGYNYCVSQNLA